MSESLTHATLVVKPSPARRSRLNPTLGLIFAACAVISLARLPLWLALVAVGAAVALVALAILWQRLWARTAAVMLVGDTVVLRGWRGERMLVVGRSGGRVAEYRMRGAPADEIWQVWLDAGGAGTWTAMGSQWPIEQLEQLASEPVSLLRPPLTRRSRRDRSLSFIQEPFPGGR